MRSALVAIHAVAGVAGLVTGLAALSPTRATDSWWWLRGLYPICIAILVVSVAVVVAIDWDGLDAVGRIAFSALTGLGAVMVYRIRRARLEASRRAEGWQERYIGHVYFTYISLWEGFVILPALNLPLPQLSVPLLALAVLLAGHVLLGRYKSRLLAV
jgi:hypothetical protein